jgi:HEAT repeat protein
MNTSWRPELPSLLLGLLLGVVLTLILNRVLPVVWLWWANLLQRFRETQAWVQSGVESRFRAETAAYVQHHHLGSRQASLAQVFVEPRFRAPEPEVDSDNVNPLFPDHLQYLWPELTSGVAVPPAPGMTLRQLLLHGRRYALVAEAGSGKSTLLAYCAHLCATTTDTGPYTFLLPVLPVFVHLAELGLISPPVPAATTMALEPENDGDEGDVAGDQLPTAVATVTETEAPVAVPDPVAALSHALQARSGPLTSAGIDALLRQKLSAGQVLLLLDGFDELAAGQRDLILDWLQRILDLYPQIQVIVAAPLQGYGPLLQRDFAVVSFFSWRMGQAERFARQWAAVKEGELLPLARFWKPGQPVLTTTLRFFFADENKETMAQRPLRLLDIMESFLCALLPQAENDPPWLAPVSRELWQKLAYRLLSESWLSVGRPQLLALIEGVLADYEVTDRGAPARLQQLLSENLLFRSWPDQSISIINPIWRDFLTAAHLAQTQKADLVKEHLLDPAWTGAIRFYVGRTGAADWLPLLLDASRPDPLFENLFQAAFWLAEAPDQGEWRRQIMIRLGQMIVKANLPLLLRQRAIFTLAQTGEQGVPAFLRQLLRQPDPHIRQAAIAALGCLEPEVALEPLAKMMTDGEVGVRRAAVHALTWLASPALEKLLLTAFVDRDEALNRAASEGIALNGGAGWELLREGLVEDDLHVRRAAVHGLSFIDEHWVLEILDKAVREDQQWMIQTAATEAIEAITARNRNGEWRRLPAGDQAWLIAWAARQGRAIPGGTAAMPVLLEVLAGADQPPLRQAAALSLSLLAPVEAVPALRAALRDNDVQVRETAFMALCRVNRAHETGL